MDIGTAKPSIADRQRIPHHLIDILPIQESYSVARFLEDANQAIDSIQKRGRLPLLVGGTMLYLKALREGLDDLPSTDKTIRLHIQTEAKLYGWSVLYQRLKEYDPVTAQRLSPGDTQRVGRALEVYLQTGKKLSSYYLSHRQPRDIKIISLEPENRSWLHQRIGRRFTEMVALGFIEEVKQLIQQPGVHKELSSMRCVGYRQVIDSLEKRQPWQTLYERGAAATRQLAKRQITWLRKMPRTIIPCDLPPQQLLHSVVRDLTTIQGQSCLL
jgi:tRNA dimethylallyltransferase